MKTITTIFWNADQNHLRAGWRLLIQFNEELAFRGYQLKNLAEGFSGKRIGSRGALVLAFLISSAFFGIAHLANGNATFLTTLNTVCAGLLICLPYMLTGELGVPIGFHLAWNLFMGTVYGFAVSGAAQSTHLLSIEVTGPGLWTGGAYGPEVEFMSLVWALVGCGFIFVWNKWLRKGAELYLPLAMYIPGQKEGGKRCVNLCG